MTLNAIVPRDPKKSNVKPIPVRLESDEMQRVEYFANKGTRSRASMMRILCILGLEQYERNQSQSAK